MWGLQAQAYSEFLQIRCTSMRGHCARGRGRRRLETPDWWVSIWGVVFEGPGLPGTSSQGLTEALF